MRAMTVGSDGSSTGLSNSVISAPPTNNLPAPVSTTALMPLFLIKLVRKGNQTFTHNAVDGVDWRIIDRDDRGHRPASPE